MISTYASGITTGTIGVEQFLSSPNVQGKFLLYVDLSNMAAGDYTEIKRWKMVVSGGTSRVIDSQGFQGAPPSGIMIAESTEVWNSLTDTNAVRFSLIQSAGTARAYSWSVLLDDALAPTTSGRTLGVDVNGNVGIATGTFIEAIADIVWDEILSQHLLAGSVGAKLNAIVTGSAGASDPWVTALPGSYTPGQAGYILASRMPTGTVIVGQNNDKTGYSLSSPQSYDRIGNTTGTLTNVLNVVNPVVAGVVTGSVLGNVNGSVNSVSNPVTAGTVTGSVLGSVNSVTQPVGISTGSFLNALSDVVWDEQLAGHLLPGSTGEKLFQSLTGTASGSDPWTTVLPGVYTGAQAGNILASRMPTGTVLVGDKTGFSLSSPQFINISGTITNVVNVINPISATITGSVTVGTNLDKTGYALTSTEHTNIADALLKRDWTAVTGEASRSVLNALRKLRNKVSYSSPTLSVKKEDDTTNAYTQTITTDANQDPFKEVG